MLAPEHCQNLFLKCLPWGRVRCHELVHGLHGDVGAEDQCRLGSQRERLEVAGLAEGELDRVGSRGRDGGNGAGHVLDAREKTGLVEEAVVDRDVEAPAAGGVEETVEAR